MGTNISQLEKEEQVSEPRLVNLQVTDILDLSNGPATKRWRIESNGAALWARENFQEYVNNNVRASDAFSSYSVWCSNNRHHPVSSTTFGKRMRE